VTVLCYHSVEPAWVSPLAIEPADFARHCAWLRAYRHVLPLDGDISVLTDGRGRSREVTAITFDDGFAGVFEHAVPALSRHALPATVFLVAATLADGGPPVDWVRPKPAEPPRMLTRDMILEMRQRGFGFGSHSFAHQDLTRLGEDECVRDLKDSRELLEGLLGAPVRLLAYPYGRHAAHVRRAAERAGYAYAFTLPESREEPGPYAIPRVGLYRGNGVFALRMKTGQWYVASRTNRLYPFLRTAWGAVRPTRRA
jgi:peptidoglycan/xylan/chitin deacetylase (PgdA/CDA1 family)